MWDSELETRHGVLGCKKHTKVEFICITVRYGYVGLGEALCVLHQEAWMHHDNTLAVSGLLLRQGDLVLFYSDQALFIQCAQCFFIIAFADAVLFVNLIGRAVIGQG